MRITKTEEEMSEEHACEVYARVYGDCPCIGFHKSQITISRPTDEEIREAIKIVLKIRAREKAKNKKNQ